MNLDLQVERSEIPPVPIYQGSIGASANLSVSIGRNAYGRPLVPGGVEMKRKLYYLLLAVGLVILSLFMMVGLLAAYPVFSMVGFIGISIMMLFLHFSDKQ